MECPITIPDNTPEGAIERWQLAIVQMTSGYIEDPGLDVQFDLEHTDMVISRGIEFSSLCEHHLFPFFGIADVAYIPDGKIVGLSKLARTVDVYSRRFQTQEKLAGEIAEAINANVRPKGVAVVLKAQHTCQRCRGIRQPGEMVTPVFLGELALVEKRKEFWNCLR